MKGVVVVALIGVDQEVATVLGRHTEWTAEPRVGAGDDITCWYHILLPIQKLHDCTALPAQPQCNSRLHI